MGYMNVVKEKKNPSVQSILQAAFTLAKTEGWASLSMRKIADAIEYSAPVVYDYFENKEAILFEILNGFINYT
jgi:AcrR family transcriptional regulator